MSKKIIVSGGLGFVGVHLIKRLLKEGNEITIVDNLSSNVVEKDFFRKDCEIIIKDIKTYTHNERFDEFYHCASIVGPAGILPHATELGYEELANARRVSKLCVKANARLMFVSSSEVYGPVHKCSESVDCIIPSKHTVRLVYGLGKLIAEHFFLNQAEVDGVDVNMIRPFNIVGENQSAKGGFVMPRFFESALKGKDITVFHDGKQLRTFTYVGDIVDGMVSIMNSDYSSEIFNVGNPKNLMSIKELAFKINDFCGNKSKVVYVNPKKIYGSLYDEAYNKVSDISKIKKLLKWEPRFSLNKIFKVLKDFYDVK